MVTSLLTMIILAIPGFLMRKKEMISKEQIDGVGKILMNYLWPGMVLQAMLSVEAEPSVLTEIQVIVIAAIAFHIGTLIFGWFYAKNRRLMAGQAPALAVCMAFSNTGLLGMPIVNSLFGAKALMLASFVELVNDCLLFTVGISFLRGEKERKEPFHWKQILSPGLVSVVVGAILFVLQLDLPEVFLRVIDYAGNACTAIAMFTIGGQIAEIKLDRVIRKKSLYEYSVIRLIMIPLVVCVLCLVFLRQYRLVSTVLVVMLAMPPAAVLPILIAQYDQDYVIATELIMMSVVGCVFTIPLWSIVTGILF